MSRPATTGAALACLLLTLGALAARLAGLGALLPHAPEEDAYIVRQAELIRAGDEPDDVWGRTVWRKYPHLLSGALSLFDLDPVELPPLEPASLEAHLLAAGRPHRLARTLVAVVSVLAVPLLWLVARRFTGPVAALAPTALFAASLLPHYLSQQARPHGPVGTFTLGCVLAALAWVERPRWSVALGAAVASGSALACLHNGVAGLLPLGAAWIWAWPRSDARLRAAAALAIVAGVGLGLALGYPFLLDAFGDPGALGDETTSGHALLLDAFRGGGFAVAARAVWHNDPLLGAFAALGLVAGLTGWRHLAPERRRAALVCAAFAVPYLLAIGLYDRSFERFALPLWPFLALLGSLGAARAGAALARLAPALRHVPLGLLLAWGLVLVARKVQLDRRADTYEVTAAWIAEHLDPADGRWLVVGRAFLPLLLEERRTEASDEAWGQLYRIPWRDHLLAHPPGEGAYGIEMVTGRAEDERRGFRRRDGRLSLALIRSVRERLIATDARYLVSLRTAGVGGRSLFEQFLGGWARPLFGASPFGDEQAFADVGYQDEHAVRRLLLGARLGPHVRVWELPR